MSTVDFPIYNLASHFPQLGYCSVQGYPLRRSFSNTAARQFWIHTKFPFKPEISDFMTPAGESL
ncbi:hypothetical protein VCO01S_12650 [Vibrio comitans NBRC 102076]|uniref:Uncharacterized protein n=1 Tax=Vibrio comitans NBRC 102076 TaxID=1219078 RepID=A0A4Y3ILZ0_9VIBR|nr:hypothetical protein VCO01S_12650 [Vibrio comitans NBRC 102076]